MNTQSSRLAARGSADAAFARLIHAFNFIILLANPYLIQLMVTFISQSQLLETATQTIVQLIQDCSPNYLVRLFVANLLWAHLAFASVELSRDILHMLGHLWDLFAPHHLLHHAAYRTGYRKHWPSYHKSTWHHNLPESSLMVLVATTFCGLAYSLPVPNYALPGSIWVLGHALKTFGSTILRLLKVHKAISVDPMHPTTPLTEPPNHWVVNPSYHYRHHFGDPNAYFGVKTSVLDKLMKTALSLKGRRIYIDTPLGALDASMRQQLEQVGAKLVPNTTQPEDASIVIINVSSVQGICPEAIIQKMESFLASVCTNEDITTKEIWLLVSNAESAVAWASLDDLYQRYLSDWITHRRLDAPCILRKIILSTSLDQTQATKTAKQIISSVKRDIRNIPIGCSTWVMLYQVLKEWIIYTYFRSVVKQP